MGFLSNQNILIVGMASNRSIAYGVAKAMQAQGANLAFSYQNDRLEARVRKLANELGSDLAFPCDVSCDKSINQLFHTLQNHWDHCDTIVHSVAFAPSDQLTHDYLNNITREGFRIAHDISSYSFAALAKAAQPMMSPGGNLLTMTYLGSSQAIPCYNTMGLAKASLEANVRYLAADLGPKGLRVNAISAGPIRTLAASGIKHFKQMLSHSEQMAPMRANVTIEQVGNTAAFLSSELASGITGEIIYVDNGLHIMGQIGQTSTTE